MNKTKVYMPKYYFTHFFTNIMSMLAAAAKKLMAVIKTTCGKLLKFFTDHVNFHPSQCHRYSAGVKHSLPTTFERSITMQISSALYF